MSALMHTSVHSHHSSKKSQSGQERERDRESDLNKTKNKKQKAKQHYVCTLKASLDLVRMRRYRKAINII
jgi:hypothetical protein